MGNNHFTSTQQSHSLLQPFLPNQPNQPKWLSSRLSSSPPWPLLPSPPPRAALMATPRSPARPWPPTPCAVTARSSPAATVVRTSSVPTALASPFSPSPSRRPAAPTSPPAARPATPRATSSTSSSTALPSPFKRSQHDEREGGLQSARSSFQQPFFVREKLGAFLGLLIGLCPFDSSLRACLGCF